MSATTTALDDDPQRCADCGAIDASWAGGHRPGCPSDDPWRCHTERLIARLDHLAHRVNALARRWGR